MKDNKRMYRNVCLVIILIYLLSALGRCNKETESYGTIICRRQGCGQKPVFQEWNRRFCSIHINDFHYCRYPGCMEEISNMKSRQYCYKHH